MKREELIAYDKWLTRRKWGTGEIISPEKAADLYLAEHPLPPAEGAEQLIRVRNILQDFYRRGDYELEQAEEDIMRIFMQQPTAEGAEEILDRLLRDYPWQHWGRENALKAMQDFATLHAQKIADKMVEERLREELGKFIKWYNSGYEQARKPHLIVKEYLKSREK